MRVWLNPAKMSVRNITTAEVVAAIREQNTPAATGFLGQQPTVDKQATQITLSTLGRLSEVEQFENIILRAYPDGRKLLLKDVGRVALDAKNLDLNVSLDGKPTIFLAIFQMPDANALEVRARHAAGRIKQSQKGSITKSVSTRLSYRESIHMFRPW